MEGFLKKLTADRRPSRRHSLRAAVRIRLRRSDTADRGAESENLSRRGVFFATDLPLNKGAALDLLIEMPEEIRCPRNSGCAPAMWSGLCPGSPRRKKNGVSVQFDFYEVSRPERPRRTRGRGAAWPGCTASRPLSARSVCVAGRRQDSDREGVGMQKL
jgi:hypothetical protein